MSVTEEERRHVFTKLEAALGPEAANSLMELLPLHSSIEVATRADLTATTLVLRSEMTDLSAGLRNEMAELRSELRDEMAGLSADLRAEMTELRAELRGEIAELRGEVVALRGELKGEFYRWGAVVVGANTIAMITALIT